MSRIQKYSLISLFVLLTIAGLWSFPLAAKGGSFNEVMGYPAGYWTYAPLSLDSEYWFPWYDQATMITWLLITNPNNYAVDVDVYIAGNYMNTYTIAANSTVYPQFPGVIGGPVQVYSIYDDYILASQRSIY